MCGRHTLWETYGNMTNSLFIDSSTERPPVDTLAPVLPGEVWRLWFL